MLNTNNTALVLIDIQGKLASLMHDREALYAGLPTLIQAVSYTHLTLPTKA